MKTSDRGVAFLAAHEGIVPGPYLDSVGVWTYGVGHTAAAGAPNPSGLPRGMPTNLETALHDVFSVFRRDLKKYEDEVSRVIGAKKVEQHEFDAAVSFHFNTGAIARAEWVRMWLAGSRTAAADSMLNNWRRPAEIIPRRTAERDLFLNATYGKNSASVWPVNESGRVTWKPVRLLSQAQIIDYLRPKAAAPAAPAPAPSGSTGPLVVIGGIIAAIAAYFGFLK